MYLVQSVDTLITILTLDTKRLPELDEFFLKNR